MEMKHNKTKTQTKYESKISKTFYYNQHKRKAQHLVSDMKRLYLDEQF
jgi:hypothetical protein